jgi:hypothetical protein
MKKWQLKKLSTGEALNEPQDLPDIWKNISSLKGSIDRLNDLTWAGHSDMGWFEVDVPEPVFDQKKFIDDQIAHFLATSLPMVAADNISQTKPSAKPGWITVNNYKKYLCNLTTPTKFGGLLAPNE